MPDIKAATAERCSMRFALAGLIMMCGLAGCQKRVNDESARAGQAVDTTVTANTRMDTTIVTKDTSVDVDTTKKHGDSAVRTDTIKR